MKGLQADLKSFFLALRNIWSSWHNKCLFTLWTRDKGEKSLVFLRVWDASQTERSSTQQDLELAPVFIPFDGTSGVEPFHGSSPHVRSKMGKEIYFASSWILLIIRKKTHCGLRSFELDHRFAALKPDTATVQSATNVVHCWAWWMADSATHSKSML